MYDDSADGFVEAESYATNKVPLHVAEKSERVLKYTKWMDYEIDWENVIGLFMLALFLFVGGLSLWQAGLGVIWLYTTGNPWFWAVPVVAVIATIKIVGMTVIRRHKRIVGKAETFGTIDE